MSRLPFRLVLAAAALVLPSATALADSYNFTISTGSTSTTPGTTFDVSGVITGQPEAGNSAILDVSSITGSGQGYSFTGIYPATTSSTNPVTEATPYGTFTFDNALYTTAGAQHVDANGILVYLSSPVGQSLAHVFEGTNGYEVDVVDPNDPGDVTPFSIAAFDISPVSPTPEPSTLALLGTGALSLAGLARRRFQR